MIIVATNINFIVSRMAQKLEAVQPGGGLYGDLCRNVATSGLALIRTRIHEQGKASDGSDIGQYSTKPMYVGVKANPGKSFGRPVGKTGKSKFASGEKAGQDHTSRYFEGGYNAYKTAIGRNELGKVNLSLSGQLNNQLTVVTTDKGFGLGWPDAEKYNRALALETKYKKKIWSPTTDEKKQLTEVAKQFVAHAIS